MTNIFIPWLKKLYPDTNEDIIMNNLINSGFNEFYTYIEDIPTTPININV